MLVRAGQATTTATVQKAPRGHLQADLVHSAREVYLAMWRRSRGREHAFAHIGSVEVRRVDPIYRRPSIGDDGTYVGGVR
jgi:hypothetical protein